MARIGAAGILAAMLFSCSGDIPNPLVPDEEPPEAPVLYNAEPASIGEITSIHGLGFATEPERNRVKFQNVDPGFEPVPATELIKTPSEEILKVRVPEGTMSGPVSVLVDGRESNSVPFYVLITVGNVPVDLLFLPDPGPGKMRALSVNLGEFLSQDHHDDSSISIIDIDATSSTFGKVLVDVRNVGLKAFEEEEVAPAGLAISPDGRRAYLAGEKNNTIYVIDPAPEDCTPEHRVEDCYIVSTLTQEDGLGPAPERLAVTPDGTRLYVGHNDRDAITVLSTSLLERGERTGNNPILHEFCGIPDPLTISFSPNGETAYVGRESFFSYLPAFGCTQRNFNNVRSLLSIFTESIDVLSVHGPFDNSFIAAIPLLCCGACPPILSDARKILFTPDGKRAYAMLRDSDAVAAISTDQKDAENYHTIMSVIPVGRRPTDMVMRPQGDFIFVNQYSPDPNVVWHTDTVTVIPICGNHKHQPFVIHDVGAGPFDIELTPDGRRLYVPIPGTVGDETNIKVIDTDPESETFCTIVHTIEFPEDFVEDFAPLKVKISPNGDFAIVLPLYLPPPKPGDTWEHAIMPDTLVMIPIVE